MTLYLHSVQLRFSELQWLFWCHISIIAQSFIRWDAKEPDQGYIEEERGKTEEGIKTKWQKCKNLFE